MVKSKLWKSYSDIPALKEEEGFPEDLGIAICRICEEPIKLSLLEEHSKHLYFVYNLFTYIYLLLRKLTSKDIVKLQIERICAHLGLRISSCR